MNFINNMFNGLTIHKIQNKDKLLRPDLSYLETPLTGHCNLNCKGCGTFSPISPERYADLKGFIRDVNGLAKLFRNIRMFRFVGGEPLLHPRVAEFCIAARKAFPSAGTGIYLVTNGILLPRMEDKFWEVLADHRVSLDLTQYPIDIDIDKISRTAEHHKITLQIKKKTEFMKFHFNTAGNTDPEKAIRACRSLYYSPFLDNGRMYPCDRPAIAHLLNSRFGTDFSACNEDHLNIHDNDLTGPKIIDFLDHPIPFCRYCTTRTPTSFKWDLSKATADEWLD